MGLTAGGSTAGTLQQHWTRLTTICPHPPALLRHADTSGTRVIGELTRPPALHNSNNKDTTSLPVRGPGHCVALVRPAQRPLLVGWRLATGDRNKCSSEDTRTQCNCQAASCQSVCRSDCLSLCLPPPPCSHRKSRRRQNQSLQEFDLDLMLQYPVAMEIAALASRSNLRRFSSEWSAIAKSSDSSWVLFANCFILSVTVVVVVLVGPCSE